MTLNEIAKKLLPKKLYQQLFLYRHIFKLITRQDSYLVKTGYVNSIKNFEPIDKDDKPIPWVNYSFIDFLEPRLLPTFNVFEYGSGYSTLYFANKVKSITSVEFDKEWFERSREWVQNYENCKILYYPDREEYINAIKENSGNQYDIIFIDGRDRIDCIHSSLPFLANRGVLILDDSWKEKFKAVHSFMNEKGFKELSFSGIKAGGFKVEKTTIFYKKENVLNI